MSDNKNLPQKKDSAEVALQKTTSLLSITNKILANRANKTLVVNDDAWLDKLIAWADGNDIPEDEFPRDKQAILALTELSLSYNQLTELPESIGKLTNLTYLGLWKNQLTEIPEWICNLTNLTGLYLGGNQLTELPESIGKLTNLTELYLYDNQLTELPESIGKLINLTELSFSKNQLTELPESIDKLTNLTVLNLCDNQLTELPESIGKLTNLTELYLEGNKLTKLPKSIDNLSNLTKLNLSNRQLTDIPDSIYICKWKFRYQCPQQWRNLMPTEIDSIRFCPTCEQNVYACYDDNAVIEHIKKQHCVAIIEDNLLGFVDFDVFDGDAFDAFDDGIPF